MLYSKIFINCVVLGVFLTSAISIRLRGLECGRRQPILPSTYSNNQPLFQEENSAQRENFPWHVSVFRRPHSHMSYSYKCGGTLISSTKNDVLIVTAAQCVTKSKNSEDPEPILENLRVVVGPSSSNYNRNKDENGSKKFKVKRIIINPHYEADGLRSDLAIIQLTERVTLGRYVQPACMPRKTDEGSQITPGMNGEIAGFGWDLRRNLSEHLRYAEYPVVAASLCQEKRQIKVNDFLEICAGSQTGLTSCQGDSGGGLVFSQPGHSEQYFLHGVLSNIDTNIRSRNGFCQNYNILTRITPFVEWVREVQEKLQKETVIASSSTTPVPIKFYLPEFARVALDLHNHYRAKHRASPVEIDETMQRNAEILADFLIAVNKLESPKESPYSTNLFAIPGTLPPSDAVREAVQFWYRSVVEYERDHPEPSSFTQLVWRNSTHIGVGVASSRERTVVVVNYWPKGNLFYTLGKKSERGKYFQQNVKSAVRGY